MSGINLVLPISYDVSDGPYKTTKNLIQAQFQNLKTLFYTRKGERVMDANFGIGIMDYIFENVSDSLLLDIRKDITEQISIYLPFIVIKNLKFDFIEETNSLYLSLYWTISGYSQLLEFNAIIAGK